MKYLFIVISLSICLSCSKQEKHKTLEQKNDLTQFSVIDALLQGIYDGFFPVAELTKYGNYGIGTFDALNGEMVLFNDTVFQVLSNGKVVIADKNETTPFAAVTQMESDTLFQLNNFSFKNLSESFNQYFPNKNSFYVIKIKAEFEAVKTRSVPKQNKPFPALVEVTKHQPKFQFKETTGDIIGFYCPQYAKGINVTGLHLHFLNAKRTGGGHILDFKVKQGSMEIGYLNNLQLKLPKDGAFLNGNFAKDRTLELEQAEK